MEDNENINKEPDVSTSSWIFVEKSAINNESDPNATTYYFKNETSGVQELIEDDLGSTSCDSDGISVISETECFLHDDCTCLPKIICDDDEDVVVKTQAAIKDDTPILTKELLEIKEPAITNEHLIKPSETDKQVNTTNSNVFAFASTVAGVCIVITYLISNYNTATKNDVTIEDFDEIYDMYLWTSYDDNETCDFNNDLIELNTDINNNNLVESYVDVAPIKLQQSDSNLPTENKKTINQNVNKEKYANKRNKRISRNSNNMINNSNKKVKTKNKNADNQNKEKTKTEHLKHHENYLKKKEKYLTKREKYLKKLEKHIVHLEARFRKLFNQLKKDTQSQFHNDYEYKPKKSKTNATGEWYEKMSIGRSEMRHKEKLSDWLFERSKMRNKLRDKAHWYFNRANGREEHRSSENLRSGKRNHFKTYRY